MAHILIVGCGDIGSRLALELLAAGHRVTGLRRRPAIAGSPFPMLVADLSQPETLAVVTDGFDAVVFIVAPDGRDSASYRALYDEGLGHLLAHFARQGCQPRWLMVSSTSVYGQQDGKWVDESSSAASDSPTARWLVAAEQRLWRDNAAHCVVRFAGIYGPGRDWLLRRSASGEPVQQQPIHYTNRIHVEDCVGILLFVLKKQLLGELEHSCYLACDDDPAPLWEVINWLALQNHYASPPPLILANDAPQNKRCCNARLKAAGYRFRYPSYRDGYRVMLAAREQAPST